MTEHAYRPIIGMCGYMGSGKDTSAAILVKQLQSRGILYRTYALAQPLKAFTASVFNLPESYMHDRVLKEHTFNLMFDGAEFKERFIAFYDQLIGMWAKSNNTTAGALLLVRPDLAAEKQYPYFLGAIRAYSYEPGFWRKVSRLLTTGNLLRDGMLFKASPRQLLQKIGTEFFRTRVSPDFWVELIPSSGVIVTDVRFLNEAGHIKSKNGLIVKVCNSSIKNIDTSHASEQYIAEIKEDFQIANDGVSMATLERAVSSIVKKIYG